MATTQLNAAAMGIARPLTEQAWASYLLWIPAAALLSFALAAFLAGVLHLPRRIYLIPYVVIVGLFLYGFLRWSGLSVASLFVHNWIWGCVGGLLVGVWTVRNILSQPASPRSEGLTLAADLVWVGVIYGAMDALLLSVLPVLATQQAFVSLGWTAYWWGKILAGIGAILSSLVVTVSYHLGFGEYRSPTGLFGPTLGNGVMTLGFVVTGSPIAAVFSHIAMHVAGVLRGPASVMQLPPHYEARSPQTQGKRR